MWPYEEYTPLENILVFLIPYAFMLLLYFLCRPVLDRKVAEKQVEQEMEYENQEY